MRRVAFFITLSLILAGLCYPQIPENLTPAAQQPQLWASVGSNFAFYGSGLPFFAPGSEGAAVFVLILFPRTPGADSYGIRVAYLLGDEHRTQLQIVESAGVCPTHLNWTPTWPCATAVVLVKGAETLKPVKLLSVAVDSQAIIGRLELKVE
ncbi:MAG TPA: hypothetical protein VNA25_20580 [Phycisphaerae bacterium]|nr:hypothetical protein [Phycisphaerae bacterium]